MISRDIRGRILITIFSLVVSLILLFFAFGYDRSLRASSIFYVYDNTELVAPVKKAAEQTEVTKEVNGKENSNIKYKESRTLLDYESEINVEEYVKENAQELIDGYILKIGSKSYNVTDKEMLDKIRKEIYSYEIKDPKALNEKMTRGQFTSYSEGNKIITGIDVEDEMEITPAQIDKNSAVTDEKELAFDLMHKDEDKEYYAVAGGDTLSSILKKNKLSESDFFLNNPQYSGEPLLGVGDELIVTPVESGIQIATYYETEKVEPVDYSIKYEKTNKLPKGTEKIKQKGKKGEDRVTYKNKEINGKVKYSTATNYKRIKEPKTKIVQVGTKEAAQESNVTTGGGFTASASSGGGGGSTEYSSQAGSANIIWPSNSRQINCGFGCYPGHIGIDIGGSYGSPVYAATDGKVIYSQYSPYGGGNELRIFKGGIIYVYAHMRDTPLPGVGSTVSQGQVVGYLGATGNVSGPHLHFEMRVGANSGDWNSGSPVDPRQYLP